MLQVEEDAEVAAILKEEQVELLPEDEIARLREIDALTGQPVQTDILHHALPMVAPISSIQSYKYRLKLTPGSQRRGKAARQVRPHCFAHLGPTVRLSLQMQITLFQLSYANIHAAVTACYLYGAFKALDAPW